MVDIHTHILPEIDDGSDSLEMSIRMARQAAAGGTKHIVASSHWNLYPYTLEEYWYALENLRHAMRRENIPVKLYAGQELMLNERAVRLLQRKQALTINDTDYLLVEFDFDEAADRMLYLLEQVRRMHYVPVIAHPERYAAVQDEVSLADAFRMLGCVLQCNVGSLLGDFGKKEKRTAEYLLDHGRIQVLATDAHEDQGRTTDARRLMQWLEKKYSSKRIKLWTSENPGRIIKGSPVLIERQEKKVVQE